MRSSSGPEIFAHVRWIIGCVQWHSPRAVVEIAAGTRIHGRGQHEARGKSQRHGRPGDADRAIFQRLAHYLQHIAGKFRQFVQKQHAVVSQRHFAGTRHRAAADQASIRNGVVRRAKRADAYQSGTGIEHAGHAVDLGGLQRFFKAEWRQDGGHALGQHGFARTGWTDHQDVVAAGAGDFQRTLGGLLAAHILEVDRIVLVFGSAVIAVHLERENAVAGVHKPDHIDQRLHWINLDPAHHGGFAGVQFGHDQAGDLLAARLNGNG